MTFPTRRFVDRVHGLIEARGGAPLEWLGTAVPGRLAALVHELAQRNHPLLAEVSRRMLRILDALVDLGGRRGAALQSSEAFRGVRLT